MPPYPNTEKQILASSVQLTGTTPPDTLPGTTTSSIRGKPKASAAAGSKEQLPRIQAELNVTTPFSPTCAQSTLPHTTISSSSSSWKKRQPIVSVTTEGEPQLPPLKTNLIVTTSQDSAEGTATMAHKRRSKVCLIPSQVQLTRLTEKELEKYIHNYDSKPVEISSRFSRHSTVVTRLITRSKQPQCKKKRTSF